MTLPQRTALFSFVLPVILISITYYLSWQGGHVELCNPFIDGCEAITATGIYYPAAYVFRGLMVAFVSFALWWYCAAAWLNSINSAGIKPWVRHLVIIAMGASVLGVASISVMGENMVPPKEHREIWRFHSITAILFFLITSLCQILMALRMHQLRDQLDYPRWSVPVKVILATAQLLTLMILIVLVVTDRETSEIVQIVEWWLAAFICVFFLTGFWDWKNFRLTRLERLSPSEKHQEANV